MKENAPQLKLFQDRPALTLFDYILAPIVALLAGMGTFKYLGTSVNWDDLLYMNLSQYTLPYPTMLNRYGHVYLQKVFFWFSGDAITGGKIYWCFLFFGSAVLMYWCTRLLVGRKNYWAGIIAVLLFIIQPLWTKFVGCLLADYAIMFWMLVFVFVYLAFLCTKFKYRNIIIIIMGLLFFWTVKSKESSFIIGVLFFTFGRNETGSFNIKLFAKDIGFVLVGMAIGCVFIMMLDWIFISEPLYSVSPSSLKAYFGFNTGVMRKPIAMSWYIVISSQLILPVFLLYAIRGREMKGPSVAVWLIPILFVSFVILSTISINWVYPERFLIPAIPLMCIFAAQFFDFKSVKSEKIKPVLGVVIDSLIIVVSILVAWFFTYKIKVMMQSDGWISEKGWNSARQFFDCIVMSLCVTVLIICLVLFKKRTMLASFCIHSCLFMLILLPLGDNITSLKQRPVAQKSEWRFEPLRVFEDEMQLGKNTKVLVSKDIHKSTWMMGRNNPSHCWMFNIYFNQELDYDQFTDGEQSDILNANYDYALVTKRDMEAIKGKQGFDKILSSYEIKSNGAVYRSRSGPVQIILLKSKTVK